MVNVVLFYLCTAAVLAAVTARFCHPLPQIKYGRVDQDSYQAQYWCAEPHKLQGGNSIRWCEEGQWTGSEPKCSDGHCKQLPSLLNGAIVYNTDLDNIQNGAIALFSCNRGYEMKGNDRRTCKDGEWTGSLPVCSKLVRCLPVTIKSGQILYSTNDTLRPGTTVAYKCNEGYRLLGSNFRLCDHLGVWSGRSPLCMKIKNSFVLHYVNVTITLIIAALLLSL